MRLTAIFALVSRAAQFGQIRPGSSTLSAIQLKKARTSWVQEERQCLTFEAGSVLNRSARGRRPGRPAPIRLTPGPLFGLPTFAGDRETGSWTPAATPDLSVKRPAPGRHHERYRAGGLGKTEADVVVPVVGVVPVPVRSTQVLRFVVPGTATDHALAASWPVPLVNPAWEKITRRRAACRRSPAAKPR